MEKKKRRYPIIAGSVIVSACLLALGMWLGYLAKQSTRPKPEPAQVQVQKKPVAKVAKKIVKTAKPAALKSSTVPTAPAPAPAPAPIPAPAPAPMIQNNINIYPALAPAPAPAPRYGPTRWVPGYQRWICEGPPENLKCYWTWKPAHYE